MRTSLKTLRKRLDPTNRSARREAVEHLSSRPGLLTPAVIGWVIGIWMELMVLCEVQGASLAVGSILVVVIGFGMTKRWSNNMLLLCAGFLLLGILRASLVPGGMDATTIPVHSIADGRIVRATGRITEVEENIRPRIGILERFGYVPCTHLLHMTDVEITTGAEISRSTDSMTVRIDAEEDSTTGFMPGDRVALRGHLYGFSANTNPGTRMRRTSEPWMKVPNQELISIRQRSVGAGYPIESLIQSWHRSVVRLLDDSLGDWGGPESRSLVRAMVLGDRSGEFNELMIPYRRTGLAHYLAVSGFALGVVIAIPRLMTPIDSRSIRGLVIMMTVVIAMVSIELRAPAWRAGIVALVVAAGSLLGRDWKRINLLSLAAFVLLMANPEELMNPGFQLSFLVVAALLILAPVVERRLGGISNERSDCQGGTILIWLRKSCACGLVAWAVATPIVFFHFGIVSPAGALMSIVAGPLVASIIILAVCAIALGVCAPWCLDPMGPLASILAEFMNQLASWFSSLPGCCLIAEPPGAAWIICCELLIWRLILHRKPWERTVMVATAVVLGGAWFVNPSSPESDSIEMTTLDVGNGTCHLIKGPSGWSMVDSGSATMRNGCSRVLLPAMKALGISEFDCVFLSHPNLDHFTMLGDLIGRIPIGRIMVGRSFVEHARSSPDGASALLLRIADQWKVEVAVAEGGQEHRSSGLIWQVLHPYSGFESSVENDHSLVLGVQGAGRDEENHFDVLFTGDIEEEAMQALLERRLEVKTTILEAPHHGSVRRSTGTFLDSIKYELIIQSTGRSRLMNDRLGDFVLQERRLVTAVHGAIQVTVDSSGRYEVNVFR